MTLELGYENSLAVRVIRESSLTVMTDVETNLPIATNNILVYPKQKLIMQYAVVTNSLLSFREPASDVYVPPSCKIGGVCAGSSSINHHTGRDYMARPTSSNTSTKEISVNFGLLKQNISYKQKVGCS